MQDTSVAARLACSIPNHSRAPRRSGGKELERGPPRRGGTLIEACELLRWLRDPKSQLPNPMPAARVGGSLPRGRDECQYAPADDGGF